MTSMRQVEAVTGVTVVRLENHLSPQRMVSVRRLGSMKSMVVSTGCAIYAEQLVGRGVAAGRVRAHAEPFGDGLEALGLFANAGAGTPPPGLVDKRPMRRVHQADDAVVDVAGQVGGEVRGAVARAEFGQFRTARLAARFNSGRCRGRE